jgi:hypothetical protein
MIYDDGDYVDIRKPVGTVPKIDIGALPKLVPGKITNGANSLNTKLDLSSVNSDDFLSDQQMQDLEQDESLMTQINEFDMVNKSFVDTAAPVKDRASLKELEADVKAAMKSIKKVRVGIKAADRLQELGFDPLAAQVYLYRKLDKEADRQETLMEAPRRLPNGDIQRFSAMAYSNTLMLQQKIANDLLRYAYARVPEGEQKTDPRVGGLTINLTGKDFDVNAALDLSDLSVSDDTVSANRISDDRIRNTVVSFDERGS